MSSAYPCSDDPSEVVEQISAAKTSAEKFDKFVNGTAFETVQLGTGSPTPAIRNVVRLMKSAAAEIDGSDISGKFVATNGGTELRMLADKLEDVISAKDFGAAGDGVTDDTAAFEALEEAFSGRFIDLCGGVYPITRSTDDLPSNNFYYNGTFVLTSPNYEEKVIELGNVAVTVYEGATTNRGTVTPSGVIFGKRNLAAKWHLFHDAFIAGSDACASINKSTNCTIAIGDAALKNGVFNDHNIAIGTWALRNLGADGPYASDAATRNVAIGSLTMAFTKTGARNIAIGRDALQNLGEGTGNVAVGYRCVCGYSPIDMANEIHPLNVFNGSLGVFIGNACAEKLIYSNLSSVIGSHTCKNVKKISTSAIYGNSNCANVGARQSFNYKEYLPVSNTIATGEATYSISGNVATITKNNHGAIAGNFVLLRFESGVASDYFDEKAFEVSSVSTNSFTIKLPFSAYSTGTCYIVEYEDSRSYLEAPYSMSGTSITVTLNGHSAAVGCYVEISFTSGPATTYSGEGQILYVSSVSGDDFVLTSPLSATGTGNCRIYGYELQNDPPYDELHRTQILGVLNFQKSNHIANVSALANGVGSEGLPGTIHECEFIGSKAAVKISDAEKTTIIGHYAAESCNQAEHAVIVGYRAARSSVSLSYDVCVGAQSGTAGTLSAKNTCIGALSGCGIGTADSCTAIGYRALEGYFDGSSAPSTLNSCTGLGAYTKVSGSYQLQLGTSAQTTYCYGAVQDRSDARDKADVRDTELGLDFIRALRPVDFRWDYRDDYVEMVERGDGVLETVRHEKDGSRKRTRFHHGLIAQEVKAVMDAQGIDFGGYQDHKVNGGADVLTIGYEEFIAPIIRAIQQIDARLSALEA